MNSDTILRILDALESQYHNESCPPELGHPEPVDGIILTVLSQNKNDINRDRAYTTLKERYPSWPDVVHAGASRLEDAIRTAGLAHTKAARIITILERVYSDFGEYSILRLAGYGRDYMREYLRELPGVGAKTVACTMLFDFKIPAFPVDTHITRISHRTGIASEKSSPEEISRMLEAVVPEERCLGGHVNMIAHGRAVCHPRKPECEECVISGICLRKFSETHSML